MTSLAADLLAELARWLPCADADDVAGAIECARDAGATDADIRTALGLCPFEPIPGAPVADEVA